MSSKTFFSRRELQGSKSSKNKNKFFHPEKFKYWFVQGSFYKLRNKFVLFLERINYYEWRTPALMKTIDLCWEGTIIGFGLWLLLQNNNFLKGPGIALLLWVAMSYLRDIKTELVKKQ